MGRVRPALRLPRMKDSRKTKIQLMNDLEELRLRIAELEASEKKRKQAEEALKSERDKLQALMDGLAQTDIGIDVVGIDYRILFQNRTLIKRFGDLTGELCYEKYMGLKKPCDFCPMIKAIKSKKMKNAKLTAVNGRSYELLSAPLPSPDGTVDKAIEVIQDITERKQVEKQLSTSLKEKEVLLREIHHRVKNNMQIIYSLLSLQSRHSKNNNVLNILKESQNRVRSMALLHEKLYQSEDLAKIEFGDYVRKLVSGLFYSYGINSDSIKIKIDIKNVFLDINMAIPCSLIISELVSNSLKYAFNEERPGRERDNTQGRIYIKLSKDKENKFILIIGDNGIGFPKDLDFRDTESLGLQLVNTLVEQLEGSVKLCRKDGTSFKIGFTPLRKKAGSLQ